MKGMIALDIDGTITTHTHKIDPEVVSCFDDLHSQGFTFVFLTGRNFSYAQSILKTFTFPYLLATENGAALFSMPEKKLLKTHEMSKKDVVEVALLFEKQELDPLLYSGQKQGDFCYFRPRRLSLQEREYLEKLQKLTPSPWVEVDRFDQIDQDTFPLMKGIGTKEQLTPIFQALQLNPLLHAKLIEDPFRRETMCYLLITHAMANKGSGLNIAKAHLEKMHGSSVFCIAAGDDFNDLEMLKNAHFAITFENAPQELKDIAHLVAKPAHENGIVEALSQATLTLK